MDYYLLAWWPWFTHVASGHSASESSDNVTDGGECGPALRIQRPS